MTKPRLAPGFLEFKPKKQVIFNDMIKKIEDVFKTYSFMPLDSPVLELSEILLAKSGGDIDNEIFRFNKGETDYCMRYDLTVPFARFVATNYNDLIFPFKRYAIGKVYRGERPQKGRYREFYQCDADIVTNYELPISYDAQAISVVCKALSAIGLKKYRINISNRKIINGILKHFKITEPNKVLILIDKIAKIGKEHFLSSIKELGLSCGEELLDFVSIKGDPIKVLNRMEQYSHYDESVQNGINELRELIKFLELMDVNLQRITIDASIIRGHNYYTGSVFEATLDDFPEFGVIGGGGRYDSLASNFTDVPLPGVGMSIGLSRLFMLLDEKGQIPDLNSSTEVLVIALGDYLDTAIATTTRLINKGIKADFIDNPKQFKNKLQTANKMGVPYIIIIGEDEFRQDMFTLKNMLTGEQERMHFDDLLLKLQKQD